MGRGRLRMSSLAIAIVLVAVGLPECLGPGPAAPQYQVWHEPYLQPAPSLDGSDSFEIRWQTRSAGPGEADSFMVAYLDSPTGRWTAVTGIEARDTGYEDRIVHVATLTGLEFATRYHYIVAHIRDGGVVALYPGVLTTRLAPGDPTPFSFAAYGDSACACDIAPFRRVQREILASNAAFALLLGDNAYEGGSHQDLDARFTPASAPEATRWRSGHVDFVAYGNHDTATDGGRPSEQVFGSPGALVPPPTSEPEEHNYSFDYGMAHFVNFDSNALADPTRLDTLVDWLVEDLEASEATWNIVFAHHPVGGGPDKPEGPDDQYFQRLIPALVNAGADLLLVGHSHTVGWTFPLTGVEEGEALFTRDLDQHYRQGDGVVQVVAGTGGKEIRVGQFTGFPFVVRGFSADTEPSAENGFALITVSLDRLEVRYVSANDGRTIDSFTIESAFALARGWDPGLPAAA